MAGKNPRAKVRLRLDKGTLLLRQFGITSITCSIIDLSEVGCQCHFGMEDLDEETAAAWKQVLSPGRVLSVELTEPPDLRNLIFREAQIRWVKACKSGDLDFGMQFSNVDDFQRDTLNQAMMSFASTKLRPSKKASEALTKTSKVPTLRAGKAAATDAAVSAFTLSANNAPEKAADPVLPAQRTPSGLYRTGTVRRPLDTPARGSTPARGPAPSGSGSRHPAPAAGEPKVPALTGSGSWQVASDSSAHDDAHSRQKRQSVYMSALYDFCDSKGGSWEHGMHQGRTVDFSEGGFKLEGPEPDCCDAGELIPREAHANVVIRSASEEVKCICRVRSVQASPNMRGFWLYGLQILTMEEKDRQQLREMYIRAGFALIKRR